MEEKISFRTTEQRIWCAQSFIDHFQQIGRPSVFLAATKLLHHLALTFRQDAIPPQAPVGLEPVDRKLRAQIREKKIALGHKPDNHEEQQGWTMTMAKRRANGEGNIRKRKDGRWEGRYTAGYDPDGKRIMKNVLGKTQAEVKEKLTTHHLQKLYNDLLSGGREREAQRDDHPGLSASTVRGVHMTLHRALDRARRERLIPRDPAEDYGVLPMFYLELVSGLRKGELVAFRWDDLNAEKKTISVSKQATYNERHEIVLTQPKTDNSIREISIPQEAVELLIQAHERHPENPYLFPTPRTDEMYHPDSVAPA